MSRGEFSFEKINFLNRPSKQVERKIIMEILHRLQPSGIDIKNYSYLGLGSIYYADFILFHKFLFIEDMKCVEREDIHERMLFNLPYGFIDLKMDSVSNIIPDLDRDKKHLVWLDYDDSLNKEILMDIAGCISVLSPGSILIITINLGKDLPKEYETEGLTKEEIKKLFLRYLRDEFGSYANEKINETTLYRKQFPIFNAGVIKNKIEGEIKNKKGLEFYQLFNYKYADGQEMLTLGGIILDSEMKVKVSDSQIGNFELCEMSAKPLLISVPPLTNREKSYLDSKINDLDLPQNCPLEIQEKYIKTYQKFYRFYPTYHETLI